MTTQLPPHILGLSFSKASPLALYLAEAILVRTNSSDHHNEAFTVGALMAAMQPFDPRELVTQRLDPVERALKRGMHWTILEAALYMGKTETPLAPKRDWPTNLASFNADLRERHEGPRARLQGNHPAINGEWLGAALVAAGCNPWMTVQDTLGQKKPKDDLPGAVSLMIRKNYSGLFERSLEIAGAWPAQKVWSAQATMTKTVAELAVTADSTNILEVLLDRGACPQGEAELAKLLSIATLKAVDLLESRISLELGPKASQEVLDAWTERHRKNEIYPEDLARISALTNKGTDVHKAYVEIKMNELLSSPWGKKPNGSRASAYDFMCDHEPSALLARERKKGGPSAGEWSLLAAAAFARIRQASHEGALGWSMHHMIKEKQESGESTSPKDFRNPTLKGCLKDAIGFDWRPGIAIDGVVALSLFGQRAQAHTQNAIGKEEFKKIDKDLQDFGLAAGLVDGNEWPMDWAVDHAQAAADFTLIMLKNPSVAQAKAMLSTWDTALQRNPNMAKAISPETAADMLQALSANFRILELAPHEYKEGIERVATALFPHLFGQGLPQHLNPSLEGADRKAHLVMLLNRPDNVFLQTSEDILEDLPSEHTDLFEHRIKAIEAPGENRKAQVQLDEWKMARALPAAAPRAPSPGKRF